MILDEFAENLGMEEGEFLDLAGLFVETSASDLGRLRLAIAAGDSQTAADAAHSIKGAAVNLGLMEISDVAKQIETEAREGRQTRVAGRMGALEQELDRFAKGLARSKQKAVGSKQ